MPRTAWIRLTYHLIRFLFGDDIVQLNDLKTGVSELPVHQCDVLVVGTGAAGFSAAITARKAGLDVLLVEKAGRFGGTTAISGGYIWIPGNPLSEKAGIKDTPAEIKKYLRKELGDAADDPRVLAYLAHGPEMVDFFVNEMGIEFNVAPQMPDYHSEQEGASQGGRSLHAKPVNGDILGKEFGRLRPLPRELALFGMGVSSGSDLSHLYKFGRSVKSTIRVASLLTRYGIDLLRFGRGRNLVNGNALIARLARVLFELKVPLWTFAPVTDLLQEGGRVVGAIVSHNGQPIQVRAALGVVLASGGFAHDVTRRSAVYKHPARSGEHISLTAPGDEGDGARMAESVGGYVDDTVSNAGAWMPISKVPRPDGTWGPFLHSVNIGKPGMISVLRNGKRFVDESLSYHDFVEKMIATPGVGSPAGAFIVCDQRAFSKYGLGYAKPFLPMRKLIDSGYLIVGDTPADLARKAGIDVDGFVATVSAYNRHAVNGNDPEFGKGRSKYGHFLGDLSHQPNPNIAPLDKGPYYAVWMYPGDIGNFSGIATDANARVIDKAGRPVEGLFAAGNDMASAFRGTYPGGGALIGPAMTFGYIAARFMASNREKVKSESAQVS